MIVVAPCLRLSQTGVKSRTHSFFCTEPVGGSRGMPSIFIYVNGACMLWGKIQVDICEP